MQTGFKFEILYRDNDLVKIRVSARNNQFGGKADVYLGTGQLVDIATQLQGFPRGILDSREVLLGAFGTDSAGGGLRMRFRCMDSSGHVCVETEIESDRDSAGRAQCAMLFVRTEPAAVDSFVDELRLLNKGAIPTASLQGTL